jgi:Na+/melibiose symporter-like transporter
MRFISMPLFLIGCLAYLAFLLGPYLLPYQALGGLRVTIIVTQFGSIALGVLAWLMFGDLRRVARAVEKLRLARGL